MHRVFVPTQLWLVMILWVAPAVATLGLAVMVRVSAPDRTSQEANQLGGAVILPLIFLAVGQSSGLLLATVPVAIAVGAVIWVVALLLVRGGAKRFTRDQLAARCRARTPPSRRPHRASQASTAGSAATWFATEPRHARMNSCSRRR